MSGTRSWNTTIAATSTGSTPGPVLALLGTVRMSLIFTLTSLVVPLPRIGREFPLDRDGLILLSAAYGLTFSGLLLFGGRVADRFGGRRVLTAGLLVFTGLAPHSPYAYGLLPGLLLLPVGAAAGFAGAAVLATDGLEPQQTGLAGGVMNTAMELGPTVVLAALLTLGSDTASLAATAVAFAAAAFLSTRTK
ncbi:MFS transporter [Streptomyces sp. NPDC126497]|uniref:MFS transporter n=1 Tax=Streptomyces sp. NPDC126497 TaxID=3155313 RepID=UPI0033178121